jgi:undecaprenyl diphosphate synthase
MHLRGSCEPSPVNIGNSVPNIKLNRSFAQARKEAGAEFGIGPERLPRHIAIIMDGNGRWAQARGLDRVHGHQVGAVRVRDIVTEAARIGVEVLTLYSFSVENWKRPADEVQALMTLCVEYLKSETDLMMDNNIRFAQFGQREGLPDALLEEVDRVTALTSQNTGMTMALALNYGARTEILDAVRSIAKRVKNGTLSVEDITEQTISDSLYTKGYPDPDLLIRTAGEMRVSNYLLWQISYAELHVCKDCWPDFHIPQLHAAIRDYASRNRKFGAVLP